MNVSFDAAPIIGAIEEMIAQELPAAVAREMYGGIMMELVPGDHSTRVCGYFSYKAHVSIEFSFGAVLSDPDGLLEGNGKERRHLKLKSLSELRGKSVEQFFRQLLIEC